MAATAEYVLATNLRSFNTFIFVSKVTDSPVLIKEFFSLKEELQSLHRYRRRL